MDIVVLRKQDHLLLLSAYNNNKLLKEGTKMHQIKKLLGSDYDRINKIIDSFNTMSKSYINLTACCSYPFKTVLEAQSAPTFILPTEGVSGNRFFPEMNCIEDIEKYSEEIILKIFKLNNLNYKATTQPHSGTQANQIVYNAILNDGDTVLSLDTRSGGHVSHNKFVKNIKLSNFGLTNNYEINYDELEQLIINEHPKLVIIGASSFPNRIDYKRIITLSHEYGALVLADLCHTVLFVLGSVYPSPFPDVDFATFTMDKTLRGPQGGILLYKSKFSDIIDYSIFPKTQGGPLQSTQFAKLVGLIELQRINIFDYAKRVQNNAKLINDYIQSCGYSTYSTDNSTHIILLNSDQFNIDGAKAERLLFENNILANKNMVPNDKRSPSITSGIRFGSTYITNQNYSEDDIKTLSDFIIKILEQRPYNKNELKKVIMKYN